MAAKITKAQVEKIMSEVVVYGIRSEKELYRYLAIHDYITINYGVFVDIMRSYKTEKGLTNIEDSQKTLRKLTPIDKEFAKYVLHLMGRDVLSTRQVFYEKAQKDGYLAEKYCKMYDKEMKVEEAKIKAKEWVKADTSQVNASIVSLAQLLSNPQSPNTIEIEEEDEG